MDIPSVVTLKDISPFLLSIFIHCLLVTSLNIFVPDKNSNLRIEVQFQQSKGGSNSQQIFKTRSEPAIKTPESAEFGSNDQSDASETGSNGRARTTILGSDLGIHAQYPRLSRVMGEQGTVEINVQDEEVSVLQSSGFARLDSSAMKATTDAIKNGLLAENLRSGNLQIRFIFRFVE